MEDEDADEDKNDARALGESLFLFLFSSSSFSRMFLLVEDARCADAVVGSVVAEVEPGAAAAAAVGTHVLRENNNRLLSRVEVQASSCWSGHSVSAADADAADADADLYC